MNRTPTIGNTGATRTRTLEKTVLVLPSWSFDPALGLLIATSTATGYADEIMNR